MKYKFSQKVNLTTGFYYGANGRVIGYQFEPNNRADQQHRYQVRLYLPVTYDYQPVDVWFWENEIAES